MVDNTENKVNLGRVLVTGGAGSIGMAICRKLRDVGWTPVSGDLPKAIELVELFSDTVLQKVYEKIEFLEFRSVDSCLVFHCLSDRSLLIAVQHTQPDLDLSSPETIHVALTGDLSKLNFFRSEKMHQHSREVEVHRLIEQGCVPSDEAFWNALVGIVSKTEA